MLEYELIVVETKGASTLVLPYEADRNFKVDIRVRSCCPEYRDRNAQFSIKLKGQADYVRHIKYSL